MMRPRTSTLAAGHPIIALPSMALWGFLGVAQAVTDGFGWLTLSALVMVGWHYNCMKQAARFHAWKREWDALDPDRQPGLSGRIGRQS